LVQASLTQYRIVTVALSAVGVAVLIRGIMVTKGQRQTKDKVWLTAAGVLTGGVFLLALVAPGMLNHFWSIDTAVATSDPNKLEVVGRTPQTQGEKKPLTAEDWVDAATQAIIQDDVRVRLESVKADTLSDKGATSYLLIHFRLDNMRGEQVIKFQGFSNPHHLPVLKDESGRSYTFLEQRQRKVERGPAVFDAPGEKLLELSSNQRAEVLLVFELPPAGALKLELPASTWGRRGVCRISITGFFDSLNSDKR